MKTYVWLTFAFLGWGYYEASGGADFQPGTANADGAAIAAEASQAETPRKVARRQAADLAPRGTVQRQLETALLTALRDKHPAAQPRTLSNVKALAFAAEAQEPAQDDQVSAAPAVARTDAPPLRPDDLGETIGESEIPVAIASNTRAAPEASLRPRLRPRALAGAPSGATLTVSTRSPAGQFASGRITASRANLRMGPGTNFPVLSAMTSGTEVRILRSGQDGWVKLKSVESGRIGWMAGHLVATP